jgi:hypothetical protein
LRPEVAGRLSSFLDENVYYERTRHLYTKMLSGGNENVPLDEWDASQDHERFAAYGKMRGLKPDAKPGLSALQFAKFQKALYDPRFADFVGALTGLELEGPSAFTSNALGAGDFIRVHSDVYREPRLRRLGYIFYLSPQCSPTGAALCTSPRTMARSSSGRSSQTRLSSSMCPATASTSRHRRTRCRGSTPHNA